MALTVIDMADWQTVQQAADKRAQGVIIKATQGNWFINKKCNSQWDTAKKAGKLLGLYHYAEGGNATQEADYFIKNISNYVHQAILFLDWEEKENRSYGNGKWIKQFVDRVHTKTGVWCVLYTGSEGAGQAAPYVKSTCALWLAGYPYKNYPSFTPPAQSIFDSLYNTHGMNLVGWQYSSTEIDHSVFYLTADQWKKYANPTGKVVTKPVVKPVAKPTPKYNLTVDGSFGPATTRALQQMYGTKPVDGIISHPYSKVVQVIQGRLGITQDGSLGPATIKAMQRKLSTHPVDGVISHPSNMVKVMQRKINSGVKPF